MDLIQDVKALAEIMKENGLTHLAYEGENEKITLKREPAAPAAVPGAVGCEAAPAGKAAGAGPSAVSAPGAEAPAEPARAVRSPMVGVFYAAKAPGEKPFVKVGDRVSVGQVLCIIEAMKLMNDIASDTAGVVKRICVKDGEVVEYGQILFELE